MKRIIALLLLIISGICYATPPIIQIGDDRFVVNPNSQFDRRQTYIPSSVSSATYATNASTLSGMTTSQIIAAVPTPSFKVKNSSIDTTEDYLNQKIIAGNGINISTENAGGNEYLNIATIGGAGEVQYFGSTDLENGYYLMKSTFNALEFSTVTITVNTNATIFVASFTTLSGYPNTTSISGSIDCHLYGKKTGNRTINYFAKFYKRALDGTLTWITDTTPTIGGFTTSITALDTDGYISKYDMLSTDRIVGVIYLVVTGPAVSTDLSFYFGNGYGSHISLPLPQITQHNSMQGLQGGVTGERYHLTETQYSNSINILSTTNTWIADQYFKSVYISTNTSITRNASSNNFAIANNVLRTNNSRYGIAFTGVTADVDMGTFMDSNIDYNKPFSVSFWYYSAAGNDYVMGNSPSGRAGSGVILQTVSGRVSFGIRQGTVAKGISHRTNYQTVNSTWNYITCAYEGTNIATGMVICINGSTQTYTLDYGTDAPMDATIASGKAWVLGTYGAGKISTIFSLDEITFTTFTMTMPQVLAMHQANYNSNTGYYGLSTDNIKAGFHCDEGTGAYIFDYKGSTSSGTMVGLASIPFGTGKVIQPSYNSTVNVISSSDGAVEKTGTVTVGASSGTTVINGELIQLAINGTTKATLDINGTLTVNNFSLSSASVANAYEFNASSGFRLPDGTLINNYASQFGIGANDITFPKNITVQPSLSVDSTTTAGNSYASNIYGMTSVEVVSTTTTPVMTSSYTPTGVCQVYGSENLETIYTAWNSFTGVVSGLVGYLATTWPTSVTVKFDNATPISSYKIAGYAYSADRGVKDWLLQGSNNGSIWTTLDTQTGQSLWTAGLIRSYTIPTANVAQYTYYRLYMTANNGHVSRIGVNQIFLINRPYTTYTGTYTQSVYSVAGGTNSNFNLNYLYGGTTYYTVTNTGNIGIGTTSPTLKLDINGAMRSAGVAVSTTTTGCYFIGITTPSVVFQDAINLSTFRKGYSTGTANCWDYYTP